LEIVVKLRKGVVDMAAVIEVKNLSFKYNGESEYALKDLSFSVEEGEFLSIIGPNAAGKSSLCNALTGLIPSYFTGKMEGSVTVLGQLTTQTAVAELSKKIGFVFQNPFNQLSYTTNTVEEELAYGLCNRGVAREEMLKRVRETAKIIRVEGFLHKNPLELSGGQVQRVAIGSALVTNPSILVLDECTTQLDPLGSEEIFDIAKHLNDKGVTVIMADHDMERVARCSNRVLVLDKGEILILDKPQVTFGDDRLERHGVDIPDYVRFGNGLRAAGMYTGQTILTEHRAIAAGRGALA
jgi:energy-coupling factor transport system ATP-binding protein